MKSPLIHYEVGPVISNLEIAPHNFVIEIENPNIARNSKPGQFVMLKPHDGGSTLLGRPFSFYKKDGPKLSFLYKIYGKGSYELSRLKKGDLVSIWGPLGKGFRETQATEWIFAAGGIGVAPFLFLAQTCPKDIKMRLYFGVRSRDQAILEEEFSDLGCEVNFFTEDGSLGKKGFATTYLKEDLLMKPSLEQIEIFVCGPRVMEAQIAKISFEYKIPCQVAYEEYMGCGLGTCMGCVVKCVSEGDWVHARVCREGPVFMADEIVWGEG